MPDDPTQSEEQGQLVMRGYRRHRKHSRWGLIALFCPLAAILWAMFWYLMMQQVEADPTAPPTSDRQELMLSQIGCLVFAGLGLLFAMLGLAGHRTRHHLASAGLVVNIAYLLILGLLIWGGAF